MAQKAKQILWACIKYAGYLSLAIIMLILVTGPAFTADMTVIWKASAGATGYELEYSANNGTTWSTPKEIGAITPVDYVSGSTHLLLCSYLWTGLPDAGLILIRVTAYNSVGKACRVDAGAWFNKSWSLPALPAGAGVQ